jgi:hypothetical protein
MRQEDWQLTNSWPMAAELRRSLLKARPSHLWHVRTLRMYAGKFKNPKQSEICALIAKVEEEFTQTLDLGAFRGENAIDLDKQIADLPNLISNLGIGASF